MGKRTGSEVDASVPVSLMHKRSNGEQLPDSKLTCVNERVSRGCW